MNISKIIAPKEATYLSEFMTTLPEGIFNKKECGCGATHLVLTNNEPTIVSVPLVEIIENKMAQLLNVFGVYQGVTEEQFIKYLNTTLVPKVMVTYDSTPKVINWLSKWGFELSKFNLVVDEYHCLLSQYSFRDKAITNLLAQLNRGFNKVTMLSATPITAQFIPNEIANYKVSEIEWSNTTKIKPIRHKTNKPYAAMGNIIKRHKAAGYKMSFNEIECKELYIFINSVTAAKDIIDFVGLTEDEVKVVCANTEQNRTILDNLKVSKALSTNKPYTFITSKAFYGVDFYTNSGFAFIVSNIKNKATMLDIATDVFQIAGRLRTKSNPFRNNICHIYNTGTCEMTREEFNTYVIEKEAITNTQIKSFNKMEVEERNAWRKRVELQLEDSYIAYLEDSGLLEFNQMLKNNEEFRFSIVNELYTNGVAIRDAYKAGGFDVSENQIFINIDEKFISNAARRSFKDVCKDYITKKALGEDISGIDNEFPLIKEAYSKLGASTLSTLKYCELRIKEALYSSSNEAKTIIFKVINKEFKCNEFYTLEFVKSTLKSIYSKYKITKLAKATDLKDYFDCEFVSKRIGNKTMSGVKVKGVILTIIK